MNLPVSPGEDAYNYPNQMNLPVSPSEDAYKYPNQMSPPASPSEDAYKYPTQMNLPAYKYLNQMNLLYTCIPKWRYIQISNPKESNVCTSVPVSPGEDAYKYPNSGTIYPA